MDDYEKLINNDNCLVALKIQDGQDKKDYKAYDLTEGISIKNLDILASTNHGNAFVLYFKFPTDLPEGLENTAIISFHAKWDTILKLFGYPIDKFAIYIAISLRPHSYSFLGYDKAQLNKKDVDYWNKRLGIVDKYNSCKSYSSAQPETFYPSQLTFNLLGEEVIGKHEDHYFYKIEFHGKSYMREYEDSIEATKKRKTQTYYPEYLDFKIGDQIVSCRHSGLGQYRIPNNIALDEEEINYRESLAAKARRDAMKANIEKQNANKKHKLILIHKKVPMNVNKIKKTLIHIKRKINHKK